MTKFEEEFKALTSWDWINVDLIQQILTRFGNWHSDEEFQELLDKYSNLNDHYEKEVIRSSKLESQLISREKQVIELREADKAQGKEIIQLKSQLQQQALPVVPECVAEFISKVKKADNNLTFAFNSKFDECPAKYWKEAIVWRLNHPEEFARAWLDGYTVEKPKLFYLENKITGMYLSSDGKEFYEHHKIHGFKFTQSEIDSMETGSYEQIEVVE
ncbi:DUF1642 domain-containing protein [Lactococcus lactis]|uniref:DUF1642 domain-containing protein n=1 Tax=Lactococcus lactis TaxID=1358 RepID=UPI0028905314|nr:DUF1642 domain-containing protein [Lactococcus lactis]MDT2905619.1 DUF1642 domain-containing protein [Lactococcus lactis]